MHAGRRRDAGRGLQSVVGNDQPKRAEAIEAGDHRDAQGRPEMEAGEDRQGATAVVGDVVRRVVEREELRPVDVGGGRLDDGVRRDAHVLEGEVGGDRRGSDDDPSGWIIEPDHHRDEQQGARHDVAGDRQSVDPEPEPERRRGERPDERADPGDHETDEVGSIGQTEVVGCDDQQRSEETTDEKAVADRDRDRSPGRRGPQCPSCRGPATAAARTITAAERERQRHEHQACDELHGRRRGEHDDRSAEDAHGGDRCAERTRRDRCVERAGIDSDEEAGRRDTRKRRRSQHVEESPDAHQRRREHDRQRDRVEGNGHRRAGDQERPHRREATQRPAPKPPIRELARKGADDRVRDHRERQCGDHRSRFDRVLRTDQDDAGEGECRHRIRREIEELGDQETTGVRVAPGIDVPAGSFEPSGSGVVVGHGHRFVGSGHRFLVT